MFRSIVEGKPMKLRLLVLMVCTLVSVTALAEDDLINEEWVISAHGLHSTSFELRGPVSVRVHMTPVNNADKGVTLRIVPTEDVDACSGKAQGQCRSIPEFDGFAVRTFKHTGVVPPGRWTFYVANTENIMNRATVHVHVVMNAN
jgi:hypothetical protein